uniref:Sensor histidine kinase n=1 Tax=Desertifilum tharense IPPAS B-1220 TaxID=1781255 RepID=A0ACD5GMD5_9CYAN
MELLQAVTDQLAIAIDQAELYAQSHAAAFAAKTQAEQLSEALETLKSTQAQLIQHEKMSSLGQMIAGIAHEINNPVNFITGNLTHASNYIEDLMDLLKLYQDYYPNADRTIQDKTQDIDLEFLEEDLPSLLESMQVGAERIRQIVLSLRNFSRLDESEMKPVNIHEGIDNTLMILQHRLKPKTANQAIQVIKEYGDLPQIGCYPGQLNQVFMNILSNAIDALEASSELSAVVPVTSYSSSLPLMPTIWIQTKYINDQWIAIHVIDNGQGMSEEVRSRLFDPFLQPSQSAKVRV